MTDKPLLKPVLAALLVFVSSITGACSWQFVEPWERALLAQPTMQMASDPVNDRFEDHFYFSKEASSGGRGFSGGGCGCN